MCVCVGGGEVWYSNSSETKDNQANRNFIRGCFVSMIYIFILIVVQNIFDCFLLYIFDLYE